MSEYFEAKDSDIDVDVKDEIVSIYATSDEWGSIYVTLTFDQIMKIHTEMEGFKDVLQKEDDKY